MGPEGRDERGGEGKGDEGREGRGRGFPKSPPLKTVDPSLAHASGASELAMEGPQTSRKLP